MPRFVFRDVLYHSQVVRVYAKAIHELLQVRSGILEEPIQRQNLIWEDP